MRKRTRYLLLLVGFIFFLILAPIIVLYVRGTSYDFKTGKFVQTGILSIKSEPNKIEIYLNNSLKQKRDGDIKFLLPGEYNVELKKSGYFEWQKRLVVEEGQVTWANSQNNKLFLLKKSSPITLHENVLDFYNINSTLVYIQDNKIFVQNLEQKPTPTELPKPVDTINYINNSNVFLLSNTHSTSTNIFLFNKDTHELVDLSTILKTIPTHLEFANNQLYYLENNNLFSISPLTKKQTLVLESVKAFTFQNSNLYYIQNTKNVNSLYISSEPFTQQQILLQDVPNFTLGKLYITFNKQIFLFGDNTLYKANSAMEKIAENITTAEVDINNSNISILHSGQFDYYDPNYQNLNFVTRSGEQIKNFIVKNNIGYGFYVTNSGIHAIELDTRDKQNQYPLYSASGIKKYSIYHSEQKIFFLENSTLKTLDIR